MSYVQGLPKKIRQIINDDLTNKDNMHLRHMGFMAASCDYKQTKKVEKGRSYVNSKGYLVIEYNPDYIDQLPHSQARFFIYHLMHHLLYGHAMRMTANDMKYAHAAADMIVNNSIKNDLMAKFQDNSVIDFPDVGDNGAILDIPQAYNEDENYNGFFLYETIYNFLKDKQEQKQSEGSTGNGEMDALIDFLDSDDSEPSLDDDPNTTSDGDTIAESHIWENQIDSLLQQMSSQPGMQPAYIIERLEKMKKKKRNYLKEILYAASQLIDNKATKTWSKPNRRLPDVVKGKKRIGTCINAVLDVSGSMHGYHEKVLAFLMDNGMQINLVQCDTEVKKHEVIKSIAELKKVELIGFGGTILQPGVDYLKNDKVLRKYGTVVLTDGYCDNLDFTGLGKAMIVTCGVRVDTIPSNVKQIVVDETP